MWCSRQVLKDSRDEPFNSLSRDHILATLATSHSRGRRPFNSLSRDHASCARVAAESRQRLPFNSLSRDHVKVRYVGEYPVIAAFQLPLSGSPHVLKELVKDDERALKLSTPSLGITKAYPEMPRD